MNILKSAVHNYLLKKERRIVATTNPAVLSSFFKMVRPIYSGRDLIRVGGAGDGGYLIPDDLSGIEACFSPGVSNIADFELYLAQKDIKCFLADYSVDAAPVKHPLISFEKKFLGLTDNAKFLTINNWIKNNAETAKDLILQMDIEGAEYDVLFDISEENLQKFRIIIIEFHHLEKLITAGEFQLINLIFKKITKYFDIVHIHPNNCEVPYKYINFEIPPIIEFTFLRKDRVLVKKQINKLPHKLDHPNIKDLDDYALPACWWQ